MSLQAGTRLGPYEINCALGSGGMGEVYRARDTRLARDVAVKVLPAAFSRDPDRLRRFQLEARAAAALNNPCILAVHDFGEYEGATYIVSELLEGETLRARLGSGAIAVRKATEYALQIVRGLAAAHEKAIVHRDLKPENIFLTKAGGVKILDFGLAKLTRPEDSPMDAPTITACTEPGVILGTVGYMSPEQVRAEAVDHRSDLFSFGATFYEMLSGKHAFRRGTSAETMNAILKEDPPDLTEANRNVPSALERIVRHCLEKNPEERFHSAWDLGFALKGLTAALDSGLAPPVARAGIWVRSSWLRFALLGLGLAISAAREGQEIYPRKWNHDFIQLPVVCKKKQHRPTVSEVDLADILSRTSERKYLALFALLAATGLRIGEALGLKATDFGPNCRVLHVRRSIWRGNEQEPKTPYSVRVIDIPEVLAPLPRELRDYLSDISDYLFATAQGKPLAQRNILRILHRSRPVGFHVFRRFRMTRLRKLAVPRDLELLWMGHAPEEIGDLYSKLNDDTLFRQEWAERVGLGFQLVHFGTQNELTSKTSNVA